MTFKNSEVMLKEYFSLTNKERNGLFTLVFLCVLIFAGIKIRQQTYIVESIDLSALQDSVMKYYNSPPIKTQKKQSYYKKETVRNEHKNENSRETQTNAPVFKPSKALPIIEINAASAKELTKIKGIGEFYAKNIVKERLRIGGFKKPEELLNIYGMSEEKLCDILPQISIDSSLIMKKIPLNRADSFLLAEIPAIDPYCAAKIVKYRHQLGGFYDTKQLLEIFSIDEERYKDILLRIELDSIKIKKIDINNDDFKTIMRHPYIDGYDNTKAIFRYLEYGPISNWDEFITIPYLRPQYPERLMHYVKFEPSKEMELY